MFSFLLLPSQWPRYVDGMQAALSKKTRPTTGAAKAPKASSLSVALPPLTLDRLSIMACADGQTRSTLVAALIEEEWEGRELDRAGEARIAEVRARNKRR